MQEKRDNELQKMQEKRVNELQKVRKFLHDLKEEIHTIKKEPNGTIKDEGCNAGNQNFP